MNKPIEMTEEDWELYRTIKEREAKIPKYAGCNYGRNPEFAATLPLPGDKVVFSTPEEKRFHWQTYKEVTELFKLGETYTVKTINVASSFTCLTVEEIEGEINLMWFTWKK